MVWGCTKSQRRFEVKTWIQISIYCSKLQYKYIYPPSPCFQLPPNHRLETGVMCVCVGADINPTECGKGSAARDFGWLTGEISRPNRAVHLSLGHFLLLFQASSPPLWMPPASSGPITMTIMILAFQLRVVHVPVLLFLLPTFVEARRRLARGRPISTAGIRR